MKSRYWIILGLAAAIITLFAVPIYLYNAPLGPPLELDQPPEAAAAESAVEPAAPQPAKITSPLKQDNECGGEGLVNVLYLGQNLPETPVRGADSVRLMFVNYEGPTVAILSMPPDLLVDLPNNPDIDPTTLTYAFWYGKQPPPAGEPAAAREATELVAQGLLKTFDFETEKYMTMNQAAFGQGITDLGGIPVDVEFFAENTFPRPDFQPGDDQQMDAQETLDYVRILSPSPEAESDWARFQRQNAVADGVYEAIIANPLKMPSAIGDFYATLVTDMKPKELRSLYCMLFEEKADYKYYEVTEGMISDYGPNGEMYPNVGAISGLIGQLENGELP